ncbi:MAG: hypothetical protein ACLT1W_06835 [Alistipes onderdonkii]
MDTAGIARTGHISATPRCGSRPDVAMTCNRAFYYSDDPTGLRGGINAAAAQDQTGHVTFEQIRPSLSKASCSSMPTARYCLFRNVRPYDGYLWQAQSYDGRRNWTMPVRSDFQTTTPVVFLRPSHGRYLYIGMPDNTRQGTVAPLVLALSEDGLITTNATSSPTTPTPGNTRTLESGDYGYPFAYIHEGWIYVTVSRQKADGRLKCKISDLR